MSGGWGLQQQDLPIQLSEGLTVGSVRLMLQSRKLPELEDFF